jgi:hypothetical protein
VTPQLVRPIPAGGATPELKYPLPFLDSQNADAVRKSLTGGGGPAPAVPAEKSIPVEKLLESMQQEKPLDVTSGITNARGRWPNGGILGDPKSQMLSEAIQH